MEQTTAETDKGWTNGIPGHAGWYFMRLADEADYPDVIVWVDSDPSGVRSGELFFPADHKILRCREYLGPISSSDTEQLIRLREALQEIKDRDTLCTCEHDTEFCCVKVKEYCAFCIAATALDPELAQRQQS